MSKNTPPVPRKGRDVVKAAEKRQWEMAVRGLGISFTLTHAQDSTATSDTSWEAIVQAIKSDFYNEENVVALNETQRQSPLPVEPPTILSRRFFPSVNCPVTEPSLRLTETEERKLMKLILTEENWSALFAIFYFFCDCFRLLDVPVMCVQKAVQCRDWRFVDVVAVDCMKLQEHFPYKMLAVLGIKNPFDRAERTHAIQELLREESNEWKDILLEIVIKAMVTICRLNGMDIQQWTAVIDTMDDFDCETHLNMSFVELALQYLVNFKIGSLLGLLNLGLERRKHYVVGSLYKRPSLMTQDNYDQALLLAMEADDWRVVARYLKLGAKLPESDTEVPPLFPLIHCNEFQLAPRYLETFDIDTRYLGSTLLHDAVDQWRADSTGFIVFNILMLLKHKADVNLKDPHGLTVLQKLVDKPSKREDENRPCENSEEAEDLFLGVRPPRQEHRLDLVKKTVTYCEQFGRDIDWTPAPGSEWTVLHVLCDGGHSDLLEHVVTLKADPFQLRHGLTLIDTALLTTEVSTQDKTKVFQHLLQIPGLVKHHVDTVRKRHTLNCDYTYPLLYLLGLATSHPDFFHLVKLLSEHGVFLDEAYTLALQDPWLTNLKTSGCQDIIEFLEGKAEEKCVDAQLGKLDIGA